MRVGFDGGFVVGWEEGWDEEGREWGVVGWGGMGRRERAGCNQDTSSR